MNHPKPVKSNVLIHRIQKEEKSAGGIVLMRTPNTKEYHRGLVLAVGPLVDEVAEGDEVLYNQHAAKPIEIDGGDYLLLSVFEVVAKVTKS